MSEYFYGNLEVKEKDYYRKLFEAVNRGDTMVRFPPVGADAVERIIRAVSGDHPELIHVNFRSVRLAGSILGMSYYVSYNAEPARWAAMRDELEKKVSEVVAAAQRENLKSEYQKCRWVHNYLVRNVQYHIEAVNAPERYPDAYTARGVFRDKKAVCEGISRAFKLLCDRLGVESMVATGTASMAGLGFTSDSNMGHAWNLVRFGKEFCHIDATWDISVSRTSRHTRYDYFCVSDRHMKKDHEYEGLPPCTTESYSYFEKRKRDFSTLDQVQAYFESELKQGADVLYFRMEGGRRPKDALAGKVQELVNKAVASSGRGACGMEMIPNKEQLCFFIRIKKR